MIANKLLGEAKKHLGVCVGLDTDLSYMPGSIAKLDLSDGEKIFLFNQKIIDATCDEAACYKPQIAYYEALGMEGLDAYAKTLRYIKSKNKIVIADIKRGDIAATAAKYAEAHFCGDFEADYVTLNAYMGEDAISPYYPYLKEKGKGMFVLVKTSNASGVDFQDIDIDGKPLYERVAKKVSEWGEAFIDESGFSSIGAVLGLTYPEQIVRAKAAMPHTFFLIPGYGAQGGTGKDIAALFEGGICGVVNSSRGIIATHLKKDSDDAYEEDARNAVNKMKEDIRQWL